MRRVNEKAKEKAPRKARAKRVKPDVVTTTISVDESGAIHTEVNEATELKAV